MPLLLKWFLLIYIITFCQVGHVGSLAKVAKSIVAGIFYANSEEMVDHLNGKFNDRICPTFFFKDINYSILDEARVNLNLMQLDSHWFFLFSLYGFLPGKASLKASKLISIYDKCKVNYRSCEKFRQYSVNVEHLNKAHLRSNDANVRSRYFIRWWW